MKNKKMKSLSMMVFIVSILPAATLILALFQMTLPDGGRTILAGLNIVFVLLGLFLSVVCVRNKESRSIVNMISTMVSILWILIMVGIVILALLINFVQ